MPRFALALLLCALVAVAMLYVAPGGGGSASATGGVLSIAAGGGHTCVVVADGGVKCWGSNSNGQLGDGTNNPSTTPVDVCASGSGPGCSGGARLTGMVSVSAGLSHTCGLTESGGVKCWGSNFLGQLGDGTTTPRMTAVDVCATGSGPACSGGQPLIGVEEVDSGVFLNCALMANTRIKCWGHNEFGQLGRGVTGGSETNPGDVCTPMLSASSNDDSSGGEAGFPIIPLCPAVTGFAGVATGGGHACGLTTEGGAKCWGSGLYGRLGNGAEDQHSSPVDVCSFGFIFPIEPILEGATSGLLTCNPVTGLVEIKAGQQHTCARTASGGGVRCWGRNLRGQLGDGTAGIGNDRLNPVTVCAGGSGATCNPLGGISAITAGTSTTCAIAAAGDARCWGDNFYGTVGDGTTDNRLNPVGVSGHSSGVALMGNGASGNHMCAVLQNGRLQCWGGNHEGQLGRGFTGSLNEAFPVPQTVVGFGAKPTPTPTSTPPPGATATPTATGVAPTATATPVVGGLTGDANCDGTVNSIDAAVLLQFLAGLIANLPCPENADVNVDGQTNAVDAALILQYVAGLLGSLPP